VLPEYDPLQSRPDFIARGPFATWTLLYEKVIAERGDLVVQLGDYSLYRIRASSRQPLDVADAAGAR
jgi:hypothetical protein